MMKRSALVRYWLIRGMRILAYLLMLTSFVRLQAATLEIHYNSQAPEIGSATSSIWSSGLKLTLGNVVRGYSSTQAVPAAWLLWSTEALHLRIQVPDQRWVQDNSLAYYYDDDALELFWGDESGGLQRLLFMPGEVPRVFLRSGSTWQPFPAGVEFAFLRGAHSYELQVSLSWELLGWEMPPSGTRLLPFDVHVHQDENGGGRDLQYTWHDLNDLAAQRVEALGSLRISGTLNQTVDFGRAEVYYAGSGIVFASADTFYTLNTHNGDYPAYYLSDSLTSDGPLMATSYWYGSFVLYPDKWIYHIQHGYQWVSRVSENSTFFYDLGLGQWLWTGDGTYPYFYVYGGRGWVYFAPSISQGGVRWFYQLDGSEPGWFSSHQ